ncbi:hypothetical protein GOP47_0021296, partial [Adiantum capillus-veneris]
RTQVARAIPARAWGAKNGAAGQHEGIGVHKVLAMIKARGEWIYKRKEGLARAPFVWSKGDKGQMAEGGELACKAGTCEAKRARRWLRRAFWCTGWACRLMMTMAAKRNQSCRELREPEFSMKEVFNTLGVGIQQQARSKLHSSRFGDNSGRTTSNVRSKQYDKKKDELQLSGPYLQEAIVL